MLPVILLSSSLDFTLIRLLAPSLQPVHSEDQPWDFFGRNDAKAETPVVWPHHAKSWLIGKDSDAGRDCRQEEKGTTEDEMAGWHHWLNGCESEWTLGAGDGQGGLACCDSWGHKELDTTERLNWTELTITPLQYPLFHYSMITHMLLNPVISSQSWFYFVYYPTFDLVVHPSHFEALSSLCFQYFMFWFSPSLVSLPVSSAVHPYLTGPLMLEHLRGRSLNLFSIYTAPLVIPWNFTVLVTTSKANTLA